MHPFRASLAAALVCVAALASAQAPAPSASAPVAAQTAPASSSCHAHKDPPSPGDIAFSHRDDAKAIDLYAEEMKASGYPGNHAHDARIRAQLRSGHIPEAEADATAWAQSKPTEVWPIIAMAEVQWREGHLTDAIRGMETAKKFDPCNPQVRSDYARVESMSGLDASAAKQLDVAHKLAPLDDEIASAWIHYQSRSKQIDDISAYLASAPYLSDKERASWERRKERLGDTPASSCHIVKTVTNASIPYHTVQASGPQSQATWGLDVKLNGEKRTLEIDTGAHGLLLSKVAAEGLHLTPIVHTHAAGVGDQGAVGSYVAKVASITIGPLEFRDCDVEVLDKNGRGVMEGSSGLIGGDVFSQFLVTLDFPGRVLKLDPLPPRPHETFEAASLDTGTEVASDHVPQDAYVDPSMSDWTHIFRADHLLLLPVSVNAKPTRLFLVDTGAGLDTISPDFAKTVSKVSDDSPVEVYGISGQVSQTFTTGPLTLFFGTLHKPVSGMVAMSTSSMTREAGVDVGGIVGIHTLHQLTVKIDYRDDLMQFTYDKNRLPLCVEGAAQTTQTDCY